MTLTVLSWPGYDEADLATLLQEKVAGVEFRFITYVGGEDMLRKYARHSDGIDIVVVDAEYGRILHSRGELANVDQALVEVVRDKYFGRFSENDAPCFSPEGKPYCLVVRWGTIGLAFDRKRHSDISSRGYNALLDTDRLVLFDWYLPNMGIFAIWQHEERTGLGNPYDLAGNDFSAFTNGKMKELHPLVQEFQPNLGLVTDALYNGHATIIPGVGEWVIGQRSLKECREKGTYSKEWEVPEAGGILFVEALAIPAHLKGRPARLAKVQEVLSAFTTQKVQSRLAWRRAYASHVPREDAYEKMDSCERRILKYDGVDPGNYLRELLGRSNVHFRKVPAEYESWVSAWNRFKGPKQDGARP